MQQRSRGISRQNLSKELRKIRGKIAGRSRGDRGKNLACKPNARLGFLRSPRARTNNKHNKKPSCLAQLFLRLKPCPLDLSFRQQRAVSKFQYFKTKRKLWRGSPKNSGKFLLSQAILQTKKAIEFLYVLLQRSKQKII